MVTVRDTGEAMPRTRSASLRVAHQKDCATSSTTLESLKDCTCKPAYYTSHRDASGRQIKGVRVRDRRLAENELRKLLISIDEGKVGIVRPKDLTFNACCDQYLENLSSDFERKGSTIRSYQATLSYARPILGRTPLAQIGPPEIRRVVAVIRAPRPKREGEEPAKPSDATIAKHLRMLKSRVRGGCR
jgi:hypothetical protein